MSSVEKGIYWLGVIFGLLAGVAAIIAAIVMRKPAFAAWGVVFIVGSILAVWSGAKASPKGSLDPPSIGAVFKGIADGPWYVIAGLFVIAIILTVIFPPF